MLRPTRPELTACNSLLPSASVLLPLSTIGWRLSAPRQIPANDRQITALPPYAAHFSTYNLNVFCNRRTLVPYFAVNTVQTFRDLSSFQLFAHSLPKKGGGGGWGGNFMVNCACDEHTHPERLKGDEGPLFAPGEGAGAGSSPLRTGRNREPPAPLVIPNPVARFWRTAVRDLLSVRIDSPSNCWLWAVGCWLPTSRESRITSHMLSGNAAAS